MKKVLIVDDDKIFQKIMSEKLTRLKYKVFVASDGEEGLGKANLEKPDLILLDILMPGLDGIGFLESLQQDKDESERTPVIITSNISESDKISEAVSLGVRGYIIKSNETLEHIAQSVQDFFATTD